MFGFMNSIVNSVVDTACDFVESPVSTTINIVTQPVVDTVEVLQGLSEYELRTRAIARLGVDAVVGMGTSELIEVLSRGE